MKTLVGILLLVVTISLYSETVITSIPSSAELYGVHALSDDTVFVSGPGIWRSTNGGASFTMVHGAFVMDVRFASSTVGYALMRNPNGIAYQAPVLKTTNGGLNWYSCFTPQGTLFFTRIYVKSESEVYGIFPGALINQQCQLFRSINGGANFTMLHEIGGASIQGVVVNSLNEHYIAASNCWYSNDLLNWEMKPNSLSYVYTAPQYNGNRLFFGGISWIDNNFHPTIAYSEDRGNTWTNYVFPNPGQCQALDFSPSGIGYGVELLTLNTNYRLSRSTDNGQTWDSLITTPFMKMNNVDAAGQTAYVVGKYGAYASIMRYRDKLLSINSNNTNPKKFELKQNYPNPFNPSTMIEYSISVYTKVNITVLGINGQRIKTLVDKEQNAGSYKVSFNASELSSGTYFYRISVGNFSETKKMTLIKKKKKGRRL